MKIRDRKKKRERFSLSAVFAARVVAATLLQTTVTAAQSPVPSIAPDKQGAVEEACPIVPLPKVYRPSGRTVTLDPAAAAIVIGSGAKEPEQYAAERLQTLVARRFKCRLPILTENAVGKQVRQRFLLGRRTSHPQLDSLCRERKIDLGPESPGHDGFIIEVLDGGADQAVLVGGSDPRGVVYGAHAFFDLLNRDGNRILFPVVSVRDWPSIAWRGRPHGRPELHLEPGTFDAYAWARLNWTGLRDGPPPRRGQFGYPPAFEVNTSQARQIVAEADRRGFFLYGTVSCGRSTTAAVIRKFEELIELGADGLWLSFDDPGWRESDLATIRAVVALGKQHGIEGRMLATVPPSGSYQQIEKDGPKFNRAAAAIPGFETATWFFTRVPCARDVESAKRIGLKSLPAWWHNWPRINAGFTHGSYGGGTLRKKRKPSYLEVTSLSVGWHRPRYGNLRKAREYTDTVMMWGGLAEEYTVGVLGIWAWNPEEHDWQRTRETIYRHVFGPTCADAARRFDNALVRLKHLFSAGLGKGRGAFLCRLKEDRDREAARKLGGELDEQLRKIEAGAAAETVLDPARFKKRFLEPMRVTVEHVRGLIELDPLLFEGRWFEREMIRLVRSDRSADAEALLQKTRRRLEPALPLAAKVLDDIRGGEGLGPGWQKRLAGLDYWQKTVADMKRKEEQRLKAEADAVARAIRDMPGRFERVVNGDHNAILARIDEPPDGGVIKELQGTDWQWSTDPPSWRGMFALGLYEKASHPCAVVAFPGKTRSRPGDYAAVTMTTVIPPFQGRLMLDAYLADTKVSETWTQYRYMVLIVNGKAVWEEDIAAKRKGREWISVDISEAARGAEDLKVRFRIEDRKAVANYSSIAFLGPVRLRSVAAERKREEKGK